MTTGSDRLDAKALALFESSLDQPSGERARWIAAQTQDTELLDKALKYLRRDEDGSAGFNTGGAFHDTLDDTAIPEQVGAYKITGLIGRGGMGSVYRGERVSDDFDHDVAIKVVRPGAMSDKLIARFQTERQTLAQLIHPHIARLYDGGRLENGAPYIVMEFIDGLPITAWVDKESLSQEQRLRLFQDVCSAVSYAHQNLIIHRDITPSNVLVGSDGNVKLIDFGIAKPFDEDAVVTDMAYSLASMSFTPGFAAPERSKGAGANTLSDIYSLGKLLTELLGHGKDVELNAIIAKATALDPEGRYETVTSLSDDLQHYMTGYPVDAIPNTSNYQLRKFISRNKAGVTLVTGALLGLMTAFAITLFQYQRAETALQSASERFSETRELTSFLLNDFGDDLGKLPGTLPLQKKVSDVSAKYIDILAKAAIEDPSLETDLAISHMQLGDLLTQSGGQHLGDPEGGLKQYEAAIEILSRHANKAEATSKIRGLYADAVQLQAYINRFHFDDSSQYAAAIEIAKPIYESILQEDPDNIDAKAKLLDLRFELWMSDRQNFPDRGIDAEILSIKEGLETLFADDLSNDDYIISYGGFSYIAPIHIARKWKAPHRVVEMSDKEEYLTLLSWSKSGFNIMKQHYEDNPANPEDMYAYFWALESYLPFAAKGLAWRPSLYDLKERLGRKFETEAALREAIKRDSDFTNNLALAEQMETHLKTSDEILQRLKPFDDNTYSYLQTVYSTHRNRAYIHAGLSFEFSKAESDFRAAFAIPDQFLQFAPNNDQVRLESISLRMQLISLLEEKDEILVGSNTDKICVLLEEAYQLAFTNDADFTQDQISTNKLERITAKIEANRCRR